MLNRAVKGKVNSENKNPNLKIAKQLYNFRHTKEASETRLLLFLALILIKRYRYFSLSLPT